jgi:putative phosphoesterase
MIKPANEERIGVVSDTHGLIWPEAINALQGASLIIHAGDIGAPEILESLQEIAPVVAVRGNIDKGSWGQSFPASQVVEVGQVQFYVIHNIDDLDIDPGAAGFSAVIFGHSHKPSLEMRNGVLFLNPGSAGPRRFKLPVSVAIIEVQGELLKPQLIELTID